MKTRSSGFNSKSSFHFRLFEFCLSLGIGLSASTAGAADFFDDFNDGLTPGWIGWNGNRPSDARLVPLDGAARIVASDDPDFSRAAFVREEITLSDFYLSVDILEWDKSNSRPLGSVALLARTSLSPLHAYGLSFVPRSGTDPTKGRLLIWGVNEASGGYFETDRPPAQIGIDPQKKYRMIFTGRGQNLEGRLYALDDLATPITIETFVDNKIASGAVGIYGVDGPGFDNLPHSKLDYVIDNYYASSLDVADAFSDGNDAGWLRAFEFPGATWSFPNGGYRLQLAGAVAPLAVSVHGTRTYRDFEIATDVTQWDSQLDQAFGIFARVGPPNSLGIPTGYAFVYKPRNAVVPFGEPGVGNLEIAAITAASISGQAVTRIELDPARTYRFVFTGQGPQLTGRVFASDNLTQPLATLTTRHDAIAAGGAGLVVFDRNTFINPAGPFHAGATFDNFNVIIPPPLPELAIESAIRLSWPGWASNYVLESASTLEGPWTLVPDSAAIDGDRTVLFLPASAHRRFYRLIQPQP